MKRSSAMIGLVVLVAAVVGVGGHELRLGRPGRVGMLALDLVEELGGLADVAGLQGGHALVVELLGRLVGDLIAPRQSASDWQPDRPAQAGPRPAGRRSRSAPQAAATVAPDSPFSSCLAVTRPPALFCGAHYRQRASASQAPGVSRTTSAAKTGRPPGLGQHRAAGVANRVQRQASRRCEQRAQQPMVELVARAPAVEAADDRARRRDRGRRARRAPCGARTRRRSASRPRSARRLR